MNAALSRTDTPMFSTKIRTAATSPSTPSAGQATALATSSLPTRLCLNTQSLALSTDMPSLTPTRSAFGKPNSAILLTAARSLWISSSAQVSKSGTSETAWCSCCLTATTDRVLNTLRAALNATCSCATLRTCLASALRKTSRVRPTCALSTALRLRSTSMFFALKCADLSVNLL